MRNFTRVFIFLTVLFCLLPVIGTASAAGYSNYITTPASYEEQEAFFASLQYFERLTEDAEQHPVNCFAISDSGLIALGLDTSDDAILYVYDTTGQFIYGYRFLNNHCAFAVFFEGDNLSIYWGKSRYIGTFDSEGNCIQLHKVVNCPQNSDAYHRDKYRPGKGKVGNTEYIAERGIGILAGYSRFTVKDADGNTRVIFDVTQEQNLRTTVYGVVIFISLAVVVVAFGKNRKIRK